MASHLLQDKIQVLLRFKTPCASHWLSLKLFPIVPLTHPVFATLTFLLHPPKCPSLRVFALAILFCLKLFPQKATQFAPSLPSGLCSNTFLSERPSLLPNIKEQEMTAISSTIFSPHLPPGTYICLLHISPY